MRIYKSYKSDSKDYQQIEEWLRKYTETHNTVIQKRYKALIIAKMMPIVKRIAHAIARRSYDPIEDLVQAGSIGVLRAVENFTASMGVEFRVYVGQKIIGEMKHYLRDKLKAIRVPRYIQELMYRINSFTDSLTREELNELTSYDIANAVKVPAQKVDFIFMVERRTSVISVEELTKPDEKRHLTFEELMPYDNYKEQEEIEEIRFILNDTIKYLPDDCREIVELYYYQDMAQNNIAEKLGLTEMTVSRRLKKAFNLLYDMIADGELHRMEEEVNS